MSLPAPLNGRQSIPCTLTPGRESVETRLQALRRLRSERRRQDEGRSTIRTGRPLSRRALSLAGKPCPGGWESANGYNRHGCRCEHCRHAMSTARLAHLHRAPPAA